MKTSEKVIKAALYPHILIPITLTPVSIFLLVYSMTKIGTETPAAIISYVLSAYILTLWCFRIPKIISFWKSFKNTNRFAVRWFSDARLRVNFSLLRSLIWNFAYGFFQLCLAIYHGSFWYYSAAAYYVLLALMRFFLVRHTTQYTPRENLHGELIKYRRCGIIFLFMNVTLSVMIFLTVFRNVSFIHKEITTIAMAAYTFTAFTVAIVNAIRYRKYDSPVFSASKAINLAAATVSVLTLTSTMLTTFGEGGESVFRRTMLILLGTSVSVFTVAMAIFMIVKGTRQLNKYTSADAAV